MKSLYKLSVIGAIALMFTCCSCKKEKSPIPSVIPPVTASIETMYTIISYNGGTSFNVNDTIIGITTGSVVKLTIPLNYGIDTMSTTSVGSYNGHPIYSFDHSCRNNSAYHLIGNMYYQSDSAVLVSFQQRISPYGSSNAVASYDLTYKIN